MSQPIFQQIVSDGLTQLDTSRLTPRQWQVLHHVKDCRTETMGSYRWHCDHCGQDSEWYCSCRDRHCPVCQGKAREEWLLKRQADTLPVTYHHEVFTLPHLFNGWACVHADILYKMLFKAVWQTLTEFANPRYHLDGQLGMLAVLHTWGQNLCRHIHLHCLIPGGVLTKAHQWCGTRTDGYLFPVKALSAKFRGKMLSLLQQQGEAGELKQLAPPVVKQTLEQAAQKDWVVYSKPAITHAKAVVGYLARYCNRVGVSESRLSLTAAHEVNLRYKDYRTNQPAQLVCSTSELLRRFLLHVLPKGFMRLRYYGFMANAIRQKALSWIRESLHCAEAKDTGKSGDHLTEGASTNKAMTQQGPACPQCRQPGMILLGTVRQRGIC